MAGLGLYIWVARGPASLSSLSQAAAILGWDPGVLSCLAQAGAVVRGGLDQSDVGVSWAIIGNSTI